MKKHTQYSICCLPLFLLFIIIPMMVKFKLVNNPLMDTSWYFNSASISDFFLYYKSWLVTFTGILMMILLIWQFGQIRNKNDLICNDTKIFIPLIIYILFVILSSVFSEFKYFCVHGMPDQFETVCVVSAGILAAPRIEAYLKASDTEKRALETISTQDDHVEISYKGQKLNISMIMYNSSSVNFHLTDQDQTEVN